MQVRDCRADTARARIDVKSTWHIFVPVLQDDAVFFEREAGDAVASHGAPVETDYIGVTILLEQLQHLRFVEE